MEKTNRPTNQNATKEETMFQISDVYGKPTDQLDSISIYYLHDVENETLRTRRSEEAEAWTGWVKDVTLKAMDLPKTHTFMGEISAKGLTGEDCVLAEDILSCIFGQLQGENYSPNGEARELIEYKTKVWHTSMNVGDAFTFRGTLYVCTRFGWLSMDLSYSEAGQVRITK
jgi:hypothetical protein